MVHSLFVCKNQIFGFTNRDGYGHDDDDDDDDDETLVVHIPAWLLTERMPGLRLTSFSSKSSSRQAGSIFPSSRDLLSEGPERFLANTPNPSAVKYSVDDPKVSECILISYDLFGMLAKDRDSSKEFGYHILLFDVLQFLFSLKSGVAFGTGLALGAQLEHVVAFLWGIDTKSYNTDKTEDHPIQLLKMITAHPEMVDHAAKLNGLLQCYRSSMLEPPPPAPLFDFAPKPDAVLLSPASMSVVHQNTKKKARRKRRKKKQRRKKRR